jgi:hypothetical protein
LISQDEELREAVRRRLRSATDPAAPAAAGPAAALVADLRERRRRLLDLHLEGKISSDLFAERESELNAQLAELEADLLEARRRIVERATDAEAFEEVARHLADIDIDAVWEEATDRERWILASDLLEELAFFPDHLEVKVVGTPRINVTLQEVGLRAGSSSSRVGERTRTSTSD